MPFPPDQRQTLLAVKGVGPRVIERLEQMGFQSLEQLAEADPNATLSQGAKLSGSSCWKNSPQAKDAIHAAIAAALTAVLNCRH